MKDQIQIYLYLYSRIYSFHKFLSMKSLNNWGRQITDFHYGNKKTSVKKSLFFSHKLFLG